METPDFVKFSTKSSSPPGKPLANPNIKCMRLRRVVSTFWSVVVLYNPAVKKNSIYRICDELAIKLSIISDMYLKTLSTADFRKQFHGIFHIF